jgi:uncharacterized protein (TIGR01777 family)
MEAQVRIAIPGGSGQVGTLLARHFHSLGHTVTVLSRTERASPWETVVWDGKELGPWAGAISGADVVINLAGRSVDCRYTRENRREIMDSRVDSTRAVGEAIGAAEQPPRIWINASTATIYRHSTDRDMDDVSGEIGGSESGVPLTWRFSIEVATQWEKAFFEAPTPRTRKVAMRSAMTMSPDSGGIFDILLRLARFGLGGPIASGGQYVSWIHERDFLRAVEFLMARDDMTGVVNLASPHPLPQRDFMRYLRVAYGMQAGLPATSWMVAMGAWLLRTETELILKSRRVVPRVLTDAGFDFEFAEWPAAAVDLVSRWRYSVT